MNSLQRTTIVANFHNLVMGWSTITTITYLPVIVKAEQNSIICSKCIVIGEFLIIRQETTPKNQSNKLISSVYIQKKTIGILE